MNCYLIHYMMENKKVSSFNHIQGHMNEITASKSTCILNPARGLVLLKGNKAVAILIMKLHIPLSPVQNFPLGLVQVPESQLVLGDKPIDRFDIDLGEQQHQPVGDVELVLVVQVVLGVHEILPLGLGLGGGGGVEIQVLLLPLAVLAAALDVGDERVEGDGVAGMSECEVGAEPEAAVAVVVAGFLGGLGDEQQH